jgi:2-haloacid dehalogenase
MAKHIIFDVVRTCVSFNAYFASIAATIGPKLSTYNITPKHFGYTWMTAAELKFAFLSISKSYRPYKDAMRAAAVFSWLVWPILPVSLQMRSGMLV